MKIVHLADTHIRNLKYHKEYKEVFQKIYNKINEIKPDCIVHCGDLCHTKTQISPEYVERASDFLFNLAELAPTYIILGNHDGNLRNSNRQDSITPIIQSLDHHNLHLLKNSGEVILNNDFALNVLSVFDEDNWAQPSNKERVNIALHHGSITGCQTDTGWTMEFGENDLSIFKNFDYAMLGDIHLSNQRLDDEGRIRYAGSTIQQNFGEETCKGFLLWDIKDKNKFSVKNITFTNPKPFITLLLDNKGKVNNARTIPQGARLRLISESNLSAHTLRKAIDVAKKKFKPESISLLNKGSSVNSISAEGSFTKENLRDISIQEKLINDYLTDYEIDKELAKKIHSLNKKVNDEAQIDEEVYRNVDYQILDLEWDNFFNYGNGNKINFSNLDGIVGIFGKNFSGKSSIIDSLLFTMYNSISKNSRKNLNIVNNDKECGRGKVRIQRGEKIFTIERKVEKYLKRLKKVETVEAKTIVNFSYKDISTGKTTSLNGVTRAETDRNIIKYFGTIDDFLITSMSSQMGSLTFVNEGSTKRKEILAKFLDLNLFDIKFKLAKKDSDELKTLIKQNEEMDFDSEIKKLELDLISNESETIRSKSFCGDIKKEIEHVEKKVVDLTIKIRSTPIEFIDIEVLNNDIEVHTNGLIILKEHIDELRSFIEKDNIKLEKVSAFIDQWDETLLKENQEECTNLQLELTKMLAVVEKDQDQHERYTKESLLLNEVPCGDQFSHCKFIQKAHESKQQINIVKLAIENNKKASNSLRENLIALNPDKIDEELKKFDELLSGKKDLKNRASSNNLKLTNLLTQKDSHQDKLAHFLAQQKKYEENKSSIENIKTLKFDKQEKEEEVKVKKQELLECEDKLLDLYKSHGYSEQRVETLKAQKNKFEKQKEEYEAYELFIQCMHSNGIAYDIIKKSLPSLNSEISNVLSSVVDFQIFFETDDNRLDIYIKHPDKDPSPLEMASGAEKTLAAMAIRLALVSISSLPRSQLFILDEPGTALDEERMEGFTRILDVVKSIFKTVILISHLDHLKDSADLILPINKKGEYANIQY